MMSNARRNVLYTGVTNDLTRRYREHKSSAIDGFSKKYRYHYLVYYEEYQLIEEAIAREKQLKGFARQKKNALVEQMNPQWEDLGQYLLY